jgi:hypothetical protein
LTAASTASPRSTSAVANFPVQAALNAEQQTLVSKTWTAPDGTPVLDQGQEGACVGFGTTNELLWNPVPVPNLTAKFAREKIYWVAQRDDPWPGGAYPNASPRYEGTSVLYGIKAAADLGYYTEYRWATAEKEMALGVGTSAPRSSASTGTRACSSPTAKASSTPPATRSAGTAP